MTEDNGHVFPFIYTVNLEDLDGLPLTYKKKKENTIDKKKGIVLFLRCIAATDYDHNNDVQLLWGRKTTNVWVEPPHTAGLLDLPTLFFASNPCGGRLSSQRSYKSVTIHNRCPFLNIQLNTISFS